jgi:hypothetical protein
VHSRRPRTRQGAGPGLRQHQDPTEWACSQAGDPDKSLLSLPEHVHNDAVSERVLQCARDDQAQNDTDASGGQSRLHNRLQLLPGERLLHGLRGSRRVVHGIPAAFAALVAGRLDHAKEAVDGYIRRVRPRGKEELVGLAALRCAVAEFQVPQAGDGDRGAVRLV